jgi:4-hydroxy-3-polyprenylbenzoate decarboxylase
MYATTREFVHALDQAGELARISGRVSPILEITAHADGQSKSPAPHLPSESTRRTDPRFHHLGGQALLFENVAGSDIPVVINQFGSYHRMEMALGVGTPALRAGSSAHAPGSESRATHGLEALAARLAHLVKPEPPPTLLAKLRKLPELLELARIPPKVVKRGLCHEVVLTGDRIDLKRLPLIRCWPLDGDLAAVGHPGDANDHIPGVESGPDWNATFRGRYITLGGIHTIHRDDLGRPNPPSRNIGMYRVQLLGKKHMAMHWHMHHDGARHWRSWQARGERMPVAIALGGESVLPYAATAPMPPGISELLLAGFLNKGPIPLVRCKTVPLDVPANSEIVIEGWVDVPGTPPVPGGRIETAGDRRGTQILETAGDRRGTQVLEGPFGDHTGFYSLPDRYPLLEVTAITHQRDPIYPTTVVGLPPQEDYFMGKATERLFLPLLRTIIPDIIDYDLPLFGAFHNCAFVRIRKEYPLQARRVMSAIWGAGQMAWTKAIVVVDEDVDVHDTEAVVRAIGERCHPSRDVVVTDGPLDILDHAAPYLGAGSKIGFDATVKREGEQGAGPGLGRGGTGGLPASGAVPGHITGGQAASATLGAAFNADGVPGARAVSRPAALGGHWLLVSAADAARATIDRIGAALLADPPAPYILIFGPDVDIANLDESLFHWCANVDPRRDAMRNPGGDPGVGHPLIFDATPKREGESRNGLPTRAWPPILRIDDEVRRAVTQRAGA